MAEDAGVLAFWGATAIDRECAVRPVRGTGRIVQDGAAARRRGNGGSQGGDDDTSKVNSGTYPAELGSYPNLQDCVD